MKKYTFLATVFLISAFCVKAQLVLEYSTHAPIIGDNASFFETTFIEPGNGGKDMVWDYSEFEILEKRVLSDQQTPTKNAIDKMKFPSNITLFEDDKYHFFNLTPHAYNLVGVITEKYELVYDRPVTRMTYPFTYNDYISGEIKAQAVYNTNYHIDIDGTYAVEADAYGLLILPGNRIVNTLRIKQHSSTTQVSMCDIVEVDVYKYTWMTADERYPLISTIIQEQRFSRGETKHIQETYINDKIYSCKDESNLIAGLEDENNNMFNYNVFPNPFRNDINISYSLNKEFNVTVGIYDILGKRIKDIVLNEKQNQGTYSYTIGASDIGLMPGMYFVKFEIGNKVITEKIIRTQ